MNLTFETYQERFGYPYPDAFSVGSLVVYRGDRSGSYGLTKGKVYEVVDFSEPLYQVGGGCHTSDAFVVVINDNKKECARLASAFYSFDINTNEQVNA